MDRMTARAGLTGGVVGVASAPSQIAIEWPRTEVVGTTMVALPGIPSCIQPTSAIDIRRVRLGSRVIVAVTATLVASSIRMRSAATV
ncbi:hypothetical protein K8O92_26530 [Nocardia asteroides]|nr:hypothetical protein K8O92_26530 [Nocardia asteroides]